MALLLTDLDDTLIDRADAFRRWTTRFVAEAGLPAGEVTTIQALDAGGTIERYELFRALTERYGLREDPHELSQRYRREYPTTVRCFPGVVGALARLQRLGWTVAVVTNGDDVQLEKLAAAGLGELIDRCCASELLGVAKPDGAIFRAAAERCGLDLAGGWMVGDNPAKDIAGAAEVGLSTAWLSHGRPWPAELAPPTVTATTFAEAVDRIVA